MIRNRFYLRGTTPLGLFNTVTGALFNRVWVRVIDSDTHEAVGGYWARGTDFPAATQNDQPPRPKD